jgi:C4-dicarboxylate-specific signal transduction histidine kinase
MTRSSKTRWVQEALHFLLGLLGLAALTALCFWLNSALVSASFTFLILIVLFSLRGSFISSVALSIIAVSCLNYFFAPPIFTLRVDLPEDILTLTGFLLTSLIVTLLVTRQKRAAAEQELASEQLRDAQMQLTHVNRIATVGQLTASIAHEVNQPVTALVTNAQSALHMLSANPPDLKQAREALDDIIKDGRRVSEVIDHIRALVKKAPAQTHAVDVNEVVTETIALTRSAIVRNDVSLETRLDGDLPPIHGDRVQLQQVMMNLVMNAVEAMSAVDASARELRIGTDKGQEGIFVTVRDSGPPLKSEDLDRFFEAFYSTKADGMGIGLAICRSIVEAHGGRIWATANQGSGATLHISLPASRLQ